MDARLIVFGLLFWAGAALGQEFDHAHAAWTALLGRHVVLLQGGKASQLRYAGMMQERGALKAYLEGLSKVSAPELRGWTREQQMAFLINAYNANMIEKVLTRYPDIRSVWDLGRIFGNPFKDRFFSLLGKPYSLDDIEHETLRKDYRDPRIHYALNCASVGCPMLREEAYAAERLERQLDEQAARFLSDRSRNRMAGGRLELSKIFDWYKEDFEPRQAYFARHADLFTSDSNEKKLIVDGKAPIGFLDYDWTLNDVMRDAPR
jgi:hypothetical protein